MNAKNLNKHVSYCKFFLLIFLLPSEYLSADNFRFNLYNNHGVVGLINTPTARFYNEAAHGVTIYNGTPDQKVTLTSNPYDWLEASFFYTNVQGYPYPGFEYQDYKDKGFNLKLRIKKEGRLPAIALGFYDFAGTGLYSSEYVVGSYGIKNIDIHFGLGWGRLNQESDGFKNPLGYISERFKERPKNFSGPGGQFENSKFFAGEKVSPFYGISYKATKNVILKIERDTIARDISMPLVYEPRSSRFSFGADYAINENFSLGLTFERGNFFGFKFVYKNNPKQTFKKYKYEKAAEDKADNKYTKLIKNLEKNGIGVNKISQSEKFIGLELTQFIHPDIKLVEEIISQASRDAGINKNIKKDIKIADLKAVSELDNTFNDNSTLVYEREGLKRFNTITGIQFRPFLASREDFFKGALLLENNTEIILRENLFFNTNLKYSIADNFDDLIYPPVDVFPAQVRSDVKQYLKNMNNGILIGRAQFDFHLTPKNNHHFMMSAGILEDMFNGYGLEYLYFKQNTNYAYGFELFDVQKRDYNWRFGTLDYKNTLFNINFYYRNYGTIPFDMKISAGEYLAGDIGSTIEFSRTFKTGVQFGVFASFTDVSSENFGEGSFDKGIFFNIPIYGNLINYTWRPLTKDPGAKLVRRHTLHDLLVKFKPID
jgi:hypothetical protein